MNRAMSTEMKLTQLSQKSGLSISTLYEYLRNGILHPPIRRGPTKAMYDETHIKRLKTVRTMREKERLSLAEIKLSLSGNVAPQETCTAREEDAEIQNQIIDTALGLFSRKHYDKTKISDITNALHMGNGTFYRYFKSKEELFLHCLERLPKIMVSRDAWEEVKRETDYITRLRKRGNAMLGSFHSYIGMLNHTKLMIGSDNKHLADKAAECLKSLSAPLRKDLEQAIAAGQVRPMDTDLAAYLLLGINETFGHRLLMDNTYTTDSGFDFIEEFLRYALTPHALTPPSTPSFTLTQVTGPPLALTHLNCHGATTLKGHLDAGTLEIDLATLTSLSFTHTEAGSQARLVTDTGHIGTFTVDPAEEISGTTPLGTYTIKVADVQRVVRDEAQA